MDVLFNSINVRDLLSSPNIDDVTSPLSAPDLRLLINRLQVRSVDIKSKVRQYILSHYSDFSTLFSQCSDVVSRSEHLSSEVSNLIQLISDHPVEVETKAVIDDIVIRNRELKEKRELLGLLAVVLELSDKLRFVKEEIKVGRVEQAAEALRELKAVLVTSSNETTAFEERQPLVYGLLKDEWTKCFEEMQEVLLRCMDNAVWFEQENYTVHLKHQSNIKGIDGIELQTVLKAMDAVGIMDYGLSKVADLMIKHVIAPVVSFRSTIVVEETNQESRNGAEANLKILPSADPNVDSMDGGSMYSVLVDIVKFISKSLCFGNCTWMICFGRLTWPRMSDLIISNFLSKNVPDDASKLADFQKIIKCTSDFEESLKELMFIASSDGKDERLSKFADNVEVHFASRKKVEILAKARNLLLQSDFRLPEDGTRRHSKVKDDKKSESSSDLVVNLLFTSERCVVSEAASGLMKLVHGTLKDVCLSSPRVGLEFYHAARDSLLLYEAVIPVKFERQLDSINHSAVLIHNDCHYLSQEILGLAFEYRSDFPASIRELVFADLAPRFQLLAEEVLRRQIKLVIYNLKQAIDGADGFQNTHQMKQYESAKLSIDQVIFILEKVYIIWHHLLLPSAYKRSMSMVLEAVFSRIANDILLLDDIAAEETLQLQRLIHLLFENLSSLLDSVVAINQSGKLQESPTQTLDDLIPSLRKLRKLADLLDIPLKSVTEAWEAGELVNCGFTQTEVEDFIRAIFADSPLRKECLRRIESICY
ncbi:centromere/kinetochore protein zw10 homolog [Nicotiana tabacum]|uniref:Centromere/kinetochore protein zw10 homolog n=3 Tax=Nicotiana TaxID=4085 RepID=A0A1S4D652_TOBAC|nr:PREDICTED: centromere/kinetochore protein zw10 homolog isoform X1 [Nicotiana sylvestris]XP_016508887.1 PREDICTED: centromere/kinetochore protein zw10 homolog [Nicotiana tabacum]